MNQVTKVPGRGTGWLLPPKEEADVEPEPTVKKKEVTHAPDEGDQ